MSTITLMPEETNAYDASCEDLGQRWQDYFLLYYSDSTWYRWTTAVFVMLKLLTLRWVRVN